MTITKRVWTEAKKLELWGPGPWIGEADRLEWEHHGVACLMTRNPLTGTLCGYVGVPPGHPLHGKDKENAPGLTVHGDVTYAEPCDEELGVCHEAKPGESDHFWWFGFDCMHSLDYPPMLAKVFADPPGFMVYRDQRYVYAQIEKLADQLAATRR